jgi:hypothetical protein
MKARRVMVLAVSWVISFHGWDYVGLVGLLDRLPPKVAATAKVFPCYTLDSQWGMCVAYNEPNGTVQEDGSRSK